MTWQKISEGVYSYLWNYILTKMFSINEALNDPSDLHEIKQFSLVYTTKGYNFEEQNSPHKY